MVSHQEENTSCFSFLLQRRSLVPNLTLPLAHIALMALLTHQSLIGPQQFDTLTLDDCQILV